MSAKTGKPWSEVDLFDFGNSLGRGDTMWRFPRSAEQGPNEGLLSDC